MLIILDHDFKINKVNIVCDHFPLRSQLHIAFSLKHYTVEWQAGQVSSIVWHSRDEVQPLSVEDFVRYIHEFVYLANPKCAQWGFNQASAQASPLLVHGWWSDTV